MKVKSRTSLCDRKVESGREREGAWIACKTWQKAVFHCCFVVLVCCNSLHVETEYKVLLVACHPIITVCSRNEKNHFSESSYSRCPVYVCVSVPLPPS